MKNSFNGLTARVGALAVWSVTVQAQLPPFPPATNPTVTRSTAGLTIYADQVELDELLATIGDRLGIVIFMPPLQERRISLTLEDSPVSEVMRQALRGRSYVLSYEQPWLGPIEASPNRLWILAENEEAASQRLNRNNEHAVNASTPGPNANASIEEAIANAEGDDARLISNLSAIALGADEAAARERAVFAIGDLADSAGFRVITAALRDPSPAVREAAVFNLSAMQSPTAIDALEQALDDVDAEVRESAVLALSAFSDSRAAAGLRQALSDEDAAVREAAEDILGEEIWQE